MALEEENSRQSSRPPGRSWFSILLLMGLAFIVGATAGAYVMSKLISTGGTDQAALVDRPEAGPERPSDAGEPEGDHRGEPPALEMGDLRYELSLDDDQSERLSKIVESHREKAREIGRLPVPEAEKRLESLFSEIESVLTPEQADRWNKTYKERVQRWILSPRRRPSEPGEPPQGPSSGEHADAYRFDNLDTNGDGGITFGELTGAKIDFSEEMFKRIDADGDGKVTVEEYRAW